MGSNKSMMIKREINYFLTALSFFTRVPVGNACQYSQDALNRCNRYFPLIGVLVGGFMALSYWLLLMLFPASIALLGAMLATILFTGAFHEDGFADLCDGFGGGWQKEQILLIMKDSRLGTYGAIGLLGMLLMKCFVLFELRFYEVFTIMVLGHTVSRTMAVSTMFALDYVREDETSKSKPITKNLHSSDLWVAILLTAVVLLFIPKAIYLLALIPAFLAKWLMERWFVKHIGGYTGDCLGAIQQLTEVVFYLSVLAINMKL